MKASDWVSVEDRLPKTADYIFVCRGCDGGTWDKYEDCALNAIQYVLII